MHRSAINLGYIDDPYAALLLNSKTRSSLRGPSAPSPVGLGGASAFGGNGGAGSIPSRLGPGPASSGGGRGGGSENRRPPVINVGTHHRTYAIDAIVERFLLSSNDDENDGLEGKGKGRKGKKQIVSLGAGSDTRFWKIRVSFHFSNRERQQGPDRRKELHVCKRKTFWLILFDPLLLFIVGC